MSSISIQTIIRKFEIFSDRDSPIRSAYNIAETALWDIDLVSCMFLFWSCNCGEICLCEDYHYIQPLKSKELWCMIRCNINMKELSMLAFQSNMHWIRGKPEYVPTILPTWPFSSLCLKSYPAWPLSQELLHAHSERPVSVLSTFLQIEPNTVLFSALPYFCSCR